MRAVQCTGITKMNTRCTRREGHVKYPAPGGFHLERCRDHVNERTAFMPKFLPARTAYRNARTYEEDEDEEVDEDDEEDEDEPASFYNPPRTTRGKDQTRSKTTDNGLHMQFENRNIEQMEKHDREEKKIFGCPIAVNRLEITKDAMAPKTRLFRTDGNTPIKKKLRAVDEVVKATLKRQNATDAALTKVAIKVAQQDETIEELNDRISALELGKARF